MKTAIIAALALVCLTLNAEARRGSYTVSHECNVTMPCEGVAPGARELERTKPFGRAVWQYQTTEATVPRGAVRQTGRPRSWCGWWLAQHRGIRDARLNLARNWAHLYGSPSNPQPGAVVVWRNHVGELVEHVSGDVWVVRSGNDGRAVRTRARSVAGAIAFRT
jgi:hypothetical protein